MGHEQAANDGLPVDHLQSVLGATLEPALVLRHTLEDLTIVGGNEAWTQLCELTTQDLMRRTPSVCMSESLVAAVESLLDGEGLERATKLSSAPDRMVGSHPVELTVTAFEREGVQRFVILTARPQPQAGGSSPLAEMLDALESAVVLVDHDGCITYANKTVGALTGWQPEDLVGSDLSRLVQDGQEADFKHHVEINGAKAHPKRLDLTHRNRRRVAVEATASFLPDPTDRVLISFRDLTRQQEHEDALAELSTVDPLTGLPHRQALIDRIAAIAASTEPCELTVAFVDLDNFKMINDDLGHDQGDIALRAIAERLRHALDDRHFVARLGGDEFVVAVAQAPDTGAAELRYQLGMIFAQPISLDGNDFQITVSIGIATTSDPAAMQPDAMLKAADLAMYEAKRNGKNCVAIYDESLEKQVTARVAIESDLRHAIEREQFVLHYQPIVDVISGRPVGAEALIRWLHPERGMVPPDEFISIAEETGLIVPMGAWVVETAIAQAARWNSSGLTRRALGISVNVSSLQLGDPQLESQVHAALSRHGFDPTHLTLEVTESTLMTDGDAALEILHRLRDVGIRIAIDDFGTGYSSLAYLKRLPARALKIDKVFVDGLGTRLEDTALVTGIIGLASALDFEIVAEGVETEVQLRELRRLGCEYSQGYLHSRPLIAEDFEAWIGNRGTRARANEVETPEVSGTLVGLVEQDGIG